MIRINFKQVVIALIVFMALIPVSGLAITKERVAEINKFIADLDRGAFTNTETIKQRTAQLKYGLTTKELTTAQMQQLNDAIARAFARLKAQPIQPTGSMLDQTLAQLEDLEIESTIPEQPKNIEVTDAPLIKPSLIDLEEPQRTTLEYELPTAGSKLTDIILGQVQAQFDQQALKQEAQVLRRLYAKAVQNPNETSNMAMSEQLDSLLTQYKDNQKLITDKFILPLLSQASIERAAIAVRDTNEFNWNSANPSTLISSKNILDDFLNGRLNLKRYNHLLETRTALATAVNNSNVNCNRVADLLAILGTYQDAMDKKRAAEACNIK